MRERIQRGTLEVRQVGDFWDAVIVLGAWVETLESFDTRGEAEAWVAERVALEGTVQDCCGGTYPRHRLGCMAAGFDR
jgi:hypothetical protein